MKKIEAPVRILSDRQLYQQSSLMKSAPEDNCILLWSRQAALFYEEKEYDKDRKITHDLSECVFRGRISGYLSVGNACRIPRRGKLPENRLRSLQKRILGLGVSGNGKSRSVENGETLISFLAGVDAAVLYLDKDINVRDRG